MEWIAKQGGGSNLTKHLKFNTVENNVSNRNRISGVWLDYFQPKVPEPKVLSYAV